jgi:hypothetical protein
MTRAYLAHAALLAALALAGCGTERAGGPVYTVRDSAGIEIVESVAPAWADGAEWRLSAEPAVQIGEMDGRPEYQFTRIRSTLRRSDGTIVVADGGAGEIRAYDSAGAHLWTTGRPGSGPGEFEQLFWVALLPGDSLLAYDFRPLRLSTFDPAGKYLRSSIVRPDKGNPSAYRFPDGNVVSPTIGDRFSDGTLLATYPGPSPRVPDGVHRFVEPFDRLGADGETLNRVATLRAGEVFLWTNPDGGTTHTSPPFARSLVTTVAGDHFYAGEGDRFEIGVYSRLGRLERLIRLRREARGVTRADRKALDSARVEAYAGRIDPVTRRMHEAMPMPASMPPYRWMRASRDGHLWVQDYLAPGDTVARWSVFAPGGRLLGSVPMPRRFDPLEIGESYVLGEWRDDLGVQYVRLYTLDRPSVGGEGQ